MHLQMKLIILENGFNVNLIKISPKCHVVSEDHIMEDKAKYVGTQGDVPLRELHHVIETNMPD